MKFINACLNCGFMDTNELKNNCPICNSVFYKLNSNDGKKLIKYNQIQRIKWVENKIGHTIPDELSKLRENYKENKVQEIEQQKEHEQSIKLNSALEHGKQILEEQACQPECPTCHSKNVQPISSIERGASIIGLGIFSKKINKSYKCKHCGYTW